MADNKDKKALNVPDKRNVPAIRFVEYREDYARTTLGKIGNTYNGLTGKSAEDFGQGSPYITYKSIFDNSRVDISRVEYVQISDIEQRNKKQNKVARGDIFFTTSSETPEEVGMTSVLLDNIADCYLNSFCFGYRVYSQEQYLPEYLRFYLRSSIIRKKLFVLAQGSTRFNLSKNEVMRIGINMPKAIEQRKIARFLSLLEERITTQNKIIEKLETLIKGIVEKTFVSSQYVTLQHYSPIITSGKDQNSGGNYPLYGSTGVIGSVLNPSYNKPIVLIARVGSIGNVQYVTAPCGISDNTLIIDAGEDNRFIYYYLNGYNFSHIISGTTQPLITASSVKKIEIPVIEKHRRKKIVSTLYAIEQKLRNEKYIAYLLSRQKYFLLSQMFI